MWWASSKLFLPLTVSVLPKILKVSPSDKVKTKNVLCLALQLAEVIRCSSNVMTQLHQYHPCRQAKMMAQMPRLCWWWVLDRPNNVCKVTAVDVFSNSLKQLWHCNSPVDETRCWGVTVLRKTSNPCCASYHYEDTITVTSAVGPVPYCDHPISHESWHPPSLSGLAIAHKKYFSFHWNSLPK